MVYSWWCRHFKYYREEEDDDGDLTFVSTAFTSSKFLIDTEFELDENDDFQPTSYVSLASQFD